PHQRQGTSRAPCLHQLDQSNLPSGLHDRFRWSRFQSTVFDVLHPCSCWFCFFAGTRKAALAPRILSAPKSASLPFPISSAMLPVGGYLSVKITPISPTRSTRQSTGCKS